MKNYHKIKNFILILTFLNLTAGCMHYRVYTNYEPKPEDIRWWIFNNKYFIMHYGDSAWQMNNITVDTNTFHFSISDLPDNHKNYLRTDPEISNVFKDTLQQNKEDVLNEVHIYCSEPIIPSDRIITYSISSISRMEVYYYDKRATIASYVAPLVLVPIVVAGAVTLIVYLTKDSCPYVYILKDDEYQFIGEIYSGAIYASLERHDYLPLPGFMPHDDRYTIKIANELPEIQYINMAELWLVDHPGGIKVIADRHGELHTLQTLHAPVTALSAGKIDVAGLLAENDQQLFLFNEEPSVTGDSMAINRVELTFRVPACQYSGKLIVKAKNSYWGDYIVGEAVKYFGQSYKDWIRYQKHVPPERPNEWKTDQKLPLMVYLETDTGWQFVDYFDMTGPLAFREMVMPVDFSGGIKRVNDSMDEAKIKIETGFMFWELDYAALDITQDEPVENEIIGTSTALNESGKDVYRFIARNDKKHYVQPVAGNEVVMNFSSPPRSPDTNRSVFLHTKGYYEHVRFYQNAPDWEQIETFQRPCRLSAFSLERFSEEKMKISLKQSPDNK